MLFAQEKGQVTGKWTNGLDRVCMIILNEVEFTRRSEYDFLKTIITENKVPMKKKYVEQSEGTNSFNIICLTNNRNVIKDMDAHDARFVHLSLDERFGGPDDGTEIDIPWLRDDDHPVAMTKKEYFRQLGGVPSDALAKVLSERDLSSFYPQQIPLTPYSCEQRVKKLPAMQQWWHKCLVSKMLPDMENELRVFEIMVPIADVQASYNAFCVSNSLQKKKIDSAQKFSKKLQAMSQVGIYGRNSSARTVRYNLDESRKIWCNVTELRNWPFDKLK